MERYEITLVTPPVSYEHGMASWARMEQQFGQSWELVDNCQHGARRAYYGVAESPTLFSCASQASACRCGSVQIGKLLSPRDHITLTGTSARIA